jgi:hypothetical protein
LEELASIIAENGSLPSIHRANLSTLKAQLHIKRGEHERATSLLVEAVAVYHETGDESKAVNAELLLASSLLALDNATEALAVCRQVRINPACTPRLFQLNALQAKVARALGNGDEERRFVARVRDELRARLGDDYAALVDVVKLAGPSFFEK